VLVVSAKKASHWKMGVVPSKGPVVVLEMLSINARGWAAEKHGFEGRTKVLEVPRRH